MLEKPTIDNYSSDAFIIVRGKSPTRQFFRIFGNYAAYYLGSDPKRTPIIGDVYWLADQAGKNAEEMIKSSLGKGTDADVIEDIKGKWYNIVDTNHVSVYSYTSVNNLKYGSVGVLVVKIPPGGSLNSTGKDIYHAFINGTEANLNDVVQDLQIGTLNSTTQSALIEDYLKNVYSTLPAGSQLNISGDSLGGFIVQEIMEKQVKKPLQDQFINKGTSVNAPNKYAFLQYGAPLALTGPAGYAAFQANVLALFNDIRNPIDPNRLEVYKTDSDVVSNIGINTAVDTTIISYKSKSIFDVPERHIFSAVDWAFKQIRRKANSVNSDNYSSYEVSKYAKSLGLSEKTVDLIRRSGSNVTSKIEKVPSGIKDPQTGKIIDNAKVTISFNTDGVDYELVGSNNINDDLTQKSIIALNKTDVVSGVIKKTNLEKLEVQQIVVEKLYDSGLANMAQLFGSTLGRQMAGRSQYLGVITGSILGTVMYNVAQTIDYNRGERIGVIREDGAKTAATSTKDVWSDFNNELRDFTAGATIGAVSSYLSMELGSALGLKGFGAEMFTTAATPLLSRLVTSIAAKIPVFSFLKPQLSPQWSASGAVQGAFVSYFATKLAAMVYSPKTEAGMVLSSLGAAAGVDAVYGEAGNDTFIIDDDGVYDFYNGYSDFDTSSVYLFCLKYVGVALGC